MAIIKLLYNSNNIITSGDENHLCGAIASLRESHKIHHTHGIDYHHMYLNSGMGLVPQTTLYLYSSMSVSPRLNQLHE
jgi:hypothetical protein